MKKPHIMKRNGTWMAYSYRIIALHGCWPLARATNMHDLFAALAKYHAPAGSQS